MGRGTSQGAKQQHIPGCGQAESTQMKEAGPPSPGPTAAAQPQGPGHPRRQSGCHNCSPLDQLRPQVTALRGEHRPPPPPEAHAAPGQLLLPGDRNWRTASLPLGLPPALPPAPGSPSAAPTGGQAYLLGLEPHRRSHPLCSFYGAMNSLTAGRQLADFCFSATD